MKFSPGTFFQNRFPLAVVAGLLLALAFPKTGIAGFAWIAPGLMLAAALDRSGAESFRIGFAAGLAHYLAALYWLLLIPYRWLGVPLGPAVGWLALASYLALFPATWVWLCLRISSSKLQLSEWPWFQRAAWTFTCATIWVALEMLLTRLLGGFPWDLLGVSQYRIVPLIQIASVTGVYGVSFLVVWTSVSLLCAMLVLVRRPNSRSIWLSEMLLPSVAVAATFAFGFHKVAHASARARELRVTLVQPAVPQTLIWDPAADTNRFRGLLELTERALTNETDLLIWPEAALPKMLRYDEDTFRAVANLARLHRVWMILGSDDAEPRASEKNSRQTDYFNSAFLISPQGQIAERYCKRNLVIFGEYIPLVRWLPFLKWFTPIDGGFTSGQKAVPFELKTAFPVKVSPLICYEDTFPQLGREGAGDDTDFLVNITNDGWFGEGAAQWQHAATACFRAVENGLPLVRCANTGLTCWIDEAGRFREFFSDPAGGIYGAGFASFNIPLKEIPTITFYNRHGDWFGWTCAAFTVARMLRCFWPLNFRRRIN